MAWLKLFFHSASSGGERSRKSCFANSGKRVMAFSCIRIAIGRSSLAWPMLICSVRCARAAINWFSATSACATVPRAS